MASDWTNPVIPLDVDDSGLSTATDALVVINWLNRSPGLMISGARPASSPFLDANADGRVSALDALVIINSLYRYPNEPSLIVGVDSASDPDGNGVVLGSSITLQGQSVPGVQLRVRSDAGVSLGNATVEDASGRFSVNVEVPAGVHDFYVSVTDPRGQSTSTTRRIRGGDFVSNWNATVLNAVRDWTTIDDDPYEGRIVPSAPPQVAWNLAMIHTAMFDAYASVEGGYQTYLPTPSPADAASATAAAVEAAYTVSTALYSDSDSMALWNAARAESLGVIDEGAGKTAGIEYGGLVGQRMLESRLQPIEDGGEGALEQLEPGLQRAPGEWDRTFPGYLPPLLPHWGDVEPFVVEDVTVFRPEPPPELSSEAYAQSLDEVMRLGGLASDLRTEDQTQIAVFWADGGGTFTPPGHWNQIASDVILTRDMPPIEKARTFALLNLALADAGIAAWDAKYFNDLWRPIDAIQQADTDGNPDTSADPHWRPLLISPPFPTYTSGHSTFSGAADAVLTALLGDNVAFSSQNDAFASPAQRPLDPTLIVTRQFSSFSSAADEAGLSRIYGGIHFSFDNTAGLEAGRQIGKAVVESQRIERIS